MNQTAEQAAHEYCNGLPYHKAHKTMGTQNIFDAFIAGAEWAEPEWIPVTESLPDGKGKYGSMVLALIGSEISVCYYTTGGQIEIEDEEEYHNDLIKNEETGKLFLPAGWVRLDEQISGEYDEAWIRVRPTHWCPVPDSLLNFKP